MLPIFVQNNQVFNAVDMTLNQKSSMQDLAEAGGYAVQSIFTGSPVGTLTVFGGNTTNTSDFVAVDTYAVSAAGNRLLNVERIHYRYIFVQYTATSGSGTLTSYVSAKRI